MSEGLKVRFGDRINRYIGTSMDSWQCIVDVPFKQVSPSPVSVGCQYNLLGLARMVSDTHPRIFHQFQLKEMRNLDQQFHRNAASVVIVRATRLQHTTLINSQPEGQRSQELERSFDLGKVTASSAAPEDKLQFGLNSDRFEIGSSQVMFLAVLIEHGKETNAVQSVGPEIV